MSFFKKKGLKEEAIPSLQEQKYIVKAEYTFLKWRKVKDAEDFFESTDTFVFPPVTLEWASAWQKSIWEKDYIDTDSSREYFDIRGAIGTYELLSKTVSLEEYKGEETNE
jgi:hypothetical protein